MDKILNTHTTSSYQVFIEDLTPTNISDISSKMDINEAWVTVAEKVIKHPYHQNITKTLRKAVSSFSPTRRLFHFLQKTYPHTQISSIIQICYEIGRIDLVEILQSIATQKDDPEWKDFERLENDLLSQPKRDKGILYYINL